MTNDQFENHSISLDSVLNSTSASDWLKLAAWSALDRDCVDAANDAEVLAQLLQQRCRDVLGLPKPTDDIPALRDWRYEVANGDTVLGYADWLEARS